MTAKNDGGDIVKNKTIEKSEQEEEADLTKGRKRQKPVFLAEISILRMGT